MRKVIVCAIMLFVGISLVSAQQYSLTPTPPMGWNSWNYWALDINEEKIRGIADAMVSSGMKDAGYQYIVIDGGWQKGLVSGGYNNLSDISGRDEDGRLIADPERFPSGIKALSDYIHALGLKFGIYTSPGKHTCGYRTGSGGYEEIDVQTFVEWGVDFIKLDWCGCEDDYKAVFKRWRKLLDECGRPIVLSLQIHRGDDYSLHRTTANMYRTTADIVPIWGYSPKEFRISASILDIIDRQEGLEQYHGNGHWCDPDMLQVGNGPLTYQENRSHFSMWSMFGAPLIAGNDLRNMSDETKEILTNKEIITIAQDPAGIKGIKVGEDTPDLEIYAKRLQKIDEQAVALLNRSDKEADITVRWDQIGITGQAFVRDLWEHKDKGLYEDKYTAKVPAHGTAFLKITANQYLQELPDYRIKKSDIPQEGLIRECEDQSCHWITGNIDDSIKGYSGIGYVTSNNHLWAPFIVTWRANLYEGGIFKLTFSYRNDSKKDVAYSCNKSDNPVLLKKGGKWQEVSIITNLKDGINWIQVITPDSQSNDKICFDYMKLTRIE